jgi:hypothetical protein
MNGRKLFLTWSGKCSGRAKLSVECEDARVSMYGQEFDIKLAVTTGVINLYFTVFICICLVKLRDIVMKPLGTEDVVDVTSSAIVRNRSGNRMLNVYWCERYNHP